jgi:enoyl-CoA hydratase/carnithine racemase
MLDGSAGSEDYLDAWEWGAFSESDGSAEDSADALAERINSGFPSDFVAKIRDLHRDGRRDPKPGAVDHWIEGG